MNRLNISVKDFTAYFVLDDISDIPHLMNPPKI